MTMPNRASRLRRSLVVALGILGAYGALAATSSAARNVVRFHSEEVVSEQTSLPECLPADLIGTQTGTEIIDGEVVTSPNGAQHVRGTTTFDYRVDFPDGRYVLGNYTERFDLNFRPGGKVTTKSSAKEPRTIYSASGEPIGRVTIHAKSHLSFDDANGNGQPDEGEVRSSVDEFRFTCR